MQYLIYHKLGTPGQAEQLIAGLKRVAGQVYPCRELITIDATDALPLAAVIAAINHFLDQHRLLQDDILYLFYPDAGGQIALWPFKKQGTLRTGTIRAKVLVDDYATIYN